ncbi:MAG: phosphatidylserine decarboxylase [Rhodospirillales bacterium]|nr:phosphatidylserine decarboxylase [Rhodospirillales bacterium]
MRHLLFPPIHRAGWPFLGAFALGTFLLAAVAAPLGWLGVVLTLWCAWFFRDPERVTPVRAGLIVSPADGVVQRIDKCAAPTELEMGATPRWRVAVFMNAFNVHVNRAPAAGTVARLAYRPGKFIDASLDKASEDNERLALRLVLGDGRDLACIQIAGLIARRILCEAAEGQTLAAGQRYGMIRFGSRVDVYLPEGVEPLVAEGQTMIAGETVLADAGSPEPRREGRAS